MPSTSDAVTLPSGRGWRIAIALLILVLIMLPLYLWPLRGGLGAFQWTGALTGGVTKDPRDPAALAGIPGDVWDALMSHAPGQPSGSSNPPDASGPRNLTMITAHESGAGLAEPDWSDAVSESPSAEELPSNLLAAVTGTTEGASGDGSSSPSSTPGQFGSSAGGGQGGAGPWPGGGGVPAIGPSGGALGFRAAASGLAFGGDESGMSPLVLNSGVDDPVAPHPAPEPGTIALVGLNVTLLFRIAWKRRRYEASTL